jgi:hypothetical protein
MTRGKCNSRLGLAFLVAAGMLVSADDCRAQARLADAQWDGAILVLGSELTMTVRFSSDSGVWSATMDIPQQGAMGLPLRNVEVELPRVHFELMGGPGLAVFDGTLAGDSITGTFAQSGVTGTFRLRHTTVAPQAPPADTAVEPAPYRSEEITFHNGDITLAGTLSLPDGPGPFPAVVLISGSGPQNRDEEIFGFRPFRLLADHLTRAGIAVVRYDDRGVGGSSGNVQMATSEDFAGDALAAVAFLRARTDIRGDAVGLMGHSEGGLVAPMASVRSPDVAFIVLLAGTSVPGDEILLAQAELILRANGASEEEVAAERELQLAVFAAVRADTGWERVRAEIGTQIRDGIVALPPAQQAAITDVESFVKTRVDQQIIGVKLPWFRFFLDFDPRTVLTKVRVPVLALFGEKDLQVPPDVNVEPMREALAAAPTTDVTIEVLPGANHLFQAAATGSPNEYASLKKEFVPGFLDLITGWIQARF